jgi:xylulokinase
MYLGIDIGTSAVKAVILDEQGTIAAESKVPLSLSRPRDLWSEQDPADWWSATNQSVVGLPVALRRQVKGIGLTGQMHGATLLDDKDQALRPAILWNDGRSGAECEELVEREPGSVSITGNLVMPGFTAPKLLWVKKHEPEVWKKIRTVLLPKDYVRLRMTGDKATDLSDASGTLWVDVARRAWSGAMLEATGLSESHMPALHEGTSATGVLRRELAEAWGMERVAVAAGAGDNAASAVGIGIVNPGDALLSLGTSGVLFVATERFSPNPKSAVHAFCHSLPARWHQMAVMLSAASCVDWAAKLTGLGDVPSLYAALEADGRGGTDEIFLPYLSGERTPHNDPHAKGVFFGLTPNTDCLALALSVLEGVAMGLADGFAALREAGTVIDGISVVGGGARSLYWGRILAAALNRRLVYRSGGEVGPAAGAARLGRLAVTGEAPEAVCTAPPITQIVEPDALMAERLAAKRHKAGKLYAGVKDLFKETLDA